MAPCICGIGTRFTRTGYCFTCSVKRRTQRERLKMILIQIEYEKNYLWGYFYRSRQNEIMDFDTFLAEEGVYGKLGKLYMLADNEVEQFSTILSYT